MIIQFLLMLALVAAFYMTWRRAKQEAVRRWEAVLWSLVWVGATIVVWRPGVSTLIANWVGIGRGSDLVLYAAVIVLLVLVFQLHVAHVALQRQLTELVRKEALRDLDHS
jgi:hypothetical protein